MSIERLPIDVVNQIAAGEVVERPAHLVKELIENSIDAGATAVEIRTFSDSLDISVKDNGSGMNSSDLINCVAPHATSKIKQFSDLHQLASYGFRGEALASIAAISEIRISSRPANAVGGTLHVEFGATVSTYEIDCSQGTEVSVKRLFANVPARSKFLKSHAAELSQIGVVVRSFALIRPEIEFKIFRDQNLLHYWPATSEWTSRVESVMEASPFLEVTHQEENLSLRIAYLPPSQVFKTSKNIWLFAQQRWIQDRSLQFAVTEGYRSTLMTKEFPAAVVDLRCPADLIDVNVHPTKSQVRFSPNVPVFRGVQRCIAQDLARGSSPQPAVVAKTPEPSAKRFDFAEIPLSQELFATTQYKRTGFVETPKVSIAASDAKSLRWSGLDVVGQIHLTYLVCQTESEMILIDQHAAHERVLYDRLLRSWRSGEVEVQSLLIPWAIDLNEADVEKLIARAGDLQRMGFEMDQGGPRTVLLRATPAGVSDRAVNEALKRMAAELLELGEQAAIEDLVTHACATLACHSAIRAGQALAFDQIKELLLQMDQVELSEFCPHGRPVSIALERDWLEHKFGRIV